MKLDSKKIIQKNKNVVVLFRFCVYEQIGENGFTY